MSAGRRPKPAGLKVLTGNPGKRPLKEGEPQPKRGRPRYPAWLSPTGRAAWDELTGHLDAIGVLTLADRKALELLVDAYAEYRDARASVRKNGVTYETLSANGALVVKARPEVAIAADAWRRIRAMLIEFGLTPAARPKITVVPNQELDPFEEFLRRGRRVEPQTAKPASPKARGDAKNHATERMSRERKNT